MKVDHEHVLPFAADRIFAVICDPRRRPEWQENTSDVEMVSEGPVTVGTRWTETTRGIGRVEAEVTALEPGVLWRESGEAAGGTGTVTVRLAPEGVGTRVSVTVELHLKGLKRVLEKVVQPMVERQLPTDLRRLEALVAAAPG